MSGPPTCLMNERVPQAHIGFYLQAVFQAGSVRRARR